MSIYVVIDGKRSGPHSEAEIRSMQATAKVNGQTLVWKAGMKEWASLNQIIPQELPPIPAAAFTSPDVEKARTESTKTTIRMISGILALFFGALSLLCVHGCDTAQKKMNAFIKGQNPADAVRMLDRTFSEGTQENPLRGLGNYFGEYKQMEEDRDMYQNFATLFLVCAGASGGVYWYFNRGNQPTT